MIGETGIESIAEALLYCSSLTKLPIIGNGVGEDSGRKIAEILGLDRRLVDDF
jgi:hypothetical protein